MPLPPASVNVDVFGSLGDRAARPRTPLRPELPAATRRSIVATTSSEVNAAPSCHLTPWRSLNVQTLPSSLGAH